MHFVDQLKSHHPWPEQFFTSLDWSVRPSSTRPLNLVLSVDVVVLTVAVGKWWGGWSPNEWDIVWILGISLLRSEFDSFN